MEAIPLFLDEVEKNLTADVMPELKQKHALLLGSDGLTQA
jgi:hypothetical protein